MIGRNLKRLACTILGVLILASVASASAANIVVPTTHRTDQTAAITANTLKPVECSGITLTSVVYCPAPGGICDGTAASELLIGSANMDTINGKGGSDCILAGGGDDDITGSQSTDICVGGPGNDVFKKCETSIQ